MILEVDTEAVIDGDAPTEVEAVRVVENESETEAVCVAEKLREGVGVTVGDRVGKGEWVVEADGMVQATAMYWPDKRLDAAHWSQDRVRTFDGDALLQVVSPTENRNTCH